MVEKILKSVKIVQKELKFLVDFLFKIDIVFKFFGRIKCQKYTGIKRLLFFMVLPSVSKAEVMNIEMNDPTIERLLWFVVILLLVLGLIVLELIRRKQQKMSYRSYHAQKEKISYLEQKIQELEKQKNKTTKVNKPKVNEEEVSSFKSSRLSAVSESMMLEVEDNDDLADLTIASTHNIGKKKEIHPKELVEATLERVKESLPSNVSIVTQIGGAPKVLVNQNLFSKSLGALIRCSAKTITGNGKITISLYASMGEAQISISDNGLGWGYKDQPSDELKALEMAKNIITSQGATFEMNTQEQKGTEMVITLGNQK